MTAPIRALRVHLGAHKTATTHLQQALHRHRDALGAADIDFLRPVELRPALRAAGRLAARCPGRAAAGSAPRSTGCGPAPAPSRSPRRTCPARSATSSTRSPTATSGRGWRRSPASPARRRSALFLAIRPFDTLWPSAHAEALRHYPHDPDRIARLRRIARTRPPSWLDVVARLRRACPAAEIRVWRYEDHAAHWRAAAAAFLGRDTGRIAERDPAELARCRPRPRASALAEAVGARDRRAAVAAIYAAHPAKAGAPFAPFDADEAAALRRRYDEDVAGLRAEGLLLAFD